MQTYMSNEHAHYIWEKRNFYKQDIPGCNEIDSDPIKNQLIPTKQRLCQEDSLDICVANQQAFIPTVNDLSFQNGLMSTVLNQVSLLPSMV